MGGEKGGEGIGNIQAELIEPREGHEKNLAGPPSPIKASRKKENGEEKDETGYFCARQ